jgi:hypothetical protein
MERWHKTMKFLYNNAAALLTTINFIIGLSIGYAQIIYFSSRFEWPTISVIIFNATLLLTEAGIVYRIWHIANNKQFEKHTIIGRYVALPVLIGTFIGFPTSFIFWMVLYG